MPKKKLVGLAIEHKVATFDQTEWISNKGLMGNSKGVCYGLSALWLAKKGGRAFHDYVDSAAAKEDVQTIQGTQTDGSQIQATLAAAGQKILRDGHLFYYPLAEMFKAIAAPGHYLIGLKAGGKGNGHAIACSNILGGGKVFDPNLGQISCKELHEMPTIVRTICSSVYPEFDTAMWIKSLS